MDSLIKDLNRRLSEALGSGDGPDQRFAWKNTADLFYYWRPDRYSSLIRYRWADRPIGKRWVLAQWRAPGAIIGGSYVPMTYAQWMETFKGQFEYPSRGTYYPHTETAIVRGELPDAETTAAHIHAIRAQLARTEVDQWMMVKNGIAADEEADANRWVEYIQDWNPAFGNFASGSRGGHVSFGGI